MMILELGYKITYWTKKVPKYFTFEGDNDDKNVSNRLGTCFEELDEVEEGFDDNEIDDNCLEHQEKFFFYGKSSSSMHKSLALRCKI